MQCIRENCENKARYGFVNSLTGMFEKNVVKFMKKKI